MKRGKNYQKAQEGFEREKAYSVQEALEILEKFPKAKFDETVEVHVRLNVDPKKSEQQVRTAAVLPHGTGKSLKIAAFTETQAAEAKKAKADLVGGEDLIAKVESGKADVFDVAVATPEMMPKLAKIAKILGPKGLMPNPKSQTVGPKIAPMIEALKKGKASFKNDNGGNIHQIVGKRSFSQEQLKENVEALLSAIQKEKPATVKGKLIKKATISSTMSPSVTVKA